MNDSGEVKNLVHFRKCNQSKLVIAHKNINSLRKKIWITNWESKRKCWHFVIFWNKNWQKLPQQSIQNSKFKSQFNPHRVDRKEKGGGIMLLFREDLPVKVLSVDKGHESCYVDLILKKTKWQINYSYNPLKIIYPHTWNLLVRTWTCTLRSLKISWCLVIYRGE